MEYKKIIKYALVISFVLTFMYSSNTFAQLKVGLINTVMITQNYSEMVEANKQIEELQQKHAKELKSMEDEFAAKSKQFESQSLLLSEERKKQRQKELEDLYLRGVKYNQEVFGQEGTLAKKYKELTDPIVEKINETIDKVASDENFDLVFDIVNMGVLYANPDKTEDITQKVSDELNKTVKK